jgi:hypothetical protein
MYSVPRIHKAEASKRCQQFGCEAGSLTKHRNVDVPETPTESEVTNMRLKPPVADKIKTAIFCNLALFQRATESYNILEPIFQTVGTW